MDDSTKALLSRIQYLEDQLFEAHIGVCWGAPGCRCDVWCRCDHRKVMKELPKCCPDCKITLRRWQKARSLTKKKDEKT